MVVISVYGVEIIKKKLWLEKGFLRWSMEPSLCTNGNAGYFMQLSVKILDLVFLYLKSWSCGMVYFISIRLLFVIVLFCLLLLQSFFFHTLRCPDETKQKPKMHACQVVWEQIKRDKQISA